MGLGSKPLAAGEQAHYTIQLPADERSPDFNVYKALNAVPSTLELPGKL